MPDIGSTLRETRMRERIDITQVETATKIRAKYLRALENEEWDLLPGPTFVKTFLRTYAEYLGLDAKMLVEEYKQRYDRPSPQELLPFAPQRGGRRPPRRTVAIPPVAVVAACVVLLIAALYALGQMDDGAERAADLPAPPTATPRGDGAADGRREREGARRRATPTRVRLRIVPTGIVNVCLVDAAGRPLIGSENLAPGAATRTFSARRLRVTFGNGQARMRVNGRTYAVPDRQDPVGYELRPGRRPRELPPAQRPTCVP